MSTKRKKELYTHSKHREKWPTCLPVDHVLDVCSHSLYPGGVLLLVPDGVEEAHDREVEFSNFSIKVNQI